jgi:hypothetical protein
MKYEVKISIDKGFSYNKIGIFEGLKNAEIAKNNYLKKLVEVPISSIKWKIIWTGFEK